MKPHESVSQLLPYKTVDLGNNYHGEITTAWCDDAHTALGNGNCVALVQSGSIQLVLQQGESSSYYSILVLNYAKLVYCTHYGDSGWTIKTIESR